MKSFTLLLTCLWMLSLALGVPAASRQVAARSDPAWIAATDASRVTRKGEWTATAYRGASRDHLHTVADGAALETTFAGTGLVVVLDAHGYSPAYFGMENLGTLTISVDGAAPTMIRPHEQDREVVVARGLAHGSHRVSVTHRGRGTNAGSRIAGFRVVQQDAGELSLLVHGEENRYLTDVRAVLSRDGTLVRDVLVRNWLTGLCRLAGLPPGKGYTLELSAVGWQTYKAEDIEIVNGRESTLAPVFLPRAVGQHPWAIEKPRLNQPAIVRPGDSFATRFGQLGVIESVTVRRHFGPAQISRRVTVREDPALTYMGYGEGPVVVPQDTPPGLYDLAFAFHYQGAIEEYVAPRAVHVVPSFPRDPVFVTFGHLDTWGQEQAEYMTRLAHVANIIAPDMVLVSNEVNAGYVTGALAHLAVPHVVNFGNHRVHGYEKWYGQTTGMVDFGPDLSILNFYGPWQSDLSHAYALLDARASRALKIINSYEHNAPVVEMLDRYGIAMLHEAHGPEPKNELLGRTPTQRVGKIDNESFRVVRFRDRRPIAFTYRGDAQAAIPFKRHQPVPLRVSYSAPNDGSQRTVTATVTNEWEQAFDNGRVVFLLPAGEYTSAGGRIESAARSDDGRYVEVAVRVDIPASGVATITVAPHQP